MDKSKLSAKTYDKIADIYTKEYYHDLSDASFLDRFLKRLVPHTRVLDVGCGPGQLVKYIMDKGFVATGIDLSKKMLAIAQTMAPQGDFRFMDMRKLAFSKETFGGLLAAYSLIHIPSKDIGKTLKEFHRVLQKDGYLAIIAQKGEADQLINEPWMPNEKMLYNLFSVEGLSQSLEKQDLLSITKPKNTMIIQICP
jgi:ubiquinone/menaquinone biosynthesis C-methylase UbiE